VLVLEQECVDERDDDNQLEKAVDVAGNVNKADEAKDGDDFFEHEDHDGKEENLPGRQVDALVPHWRGKESDKQVDSDGNESQVVEGGNGCDL